MEYLESRGHKLIENDPPSRVERGKYNKFWKCQYCDTPFQIVKIRWRESLYVLKDEKAKYWAEPDPTHDIPLCNDIIVQEVIE